MITNEQLRELLAELREARTDYDRTIMPDGAEAWSCDCGLLRRAEEAVDELAALRARIAALAAELEPLGKDSGISEWATGFAACANETARRLRALLRLPAGEGRE